MGQPGAICVQEPDEHATFVEAAALPHAFELMGVPLKITDAFSILQQYDTVRAPAGPRSPPRPPMRPPSALPDARVLTLTMGSRVISMPPPCIFHF